jgi:hypothetical protein
MAWRTGLPLDEVISLRDQLDGMLPKFGRRAIYAGRSSDARGAGMLGRPPNLTSVSAR